MYHFLEFFKFEEKEWVDIKTFLQGIMEHFVL